MIDYKEEELLVPVSKARPNPGHAHLAKLLENGLQQDGEVERNLGEHVARYSESAG